MKVISLYDNRDWLSLTFRSERFIKKGGVCNDSRINYLDILFYNNQNNIYEYNN